MSEVKLTHDELEAMLDRAAKRGAKEALASIGLLDENAHRDISDMRSLLDAWRETRRGVWTTFIKVSTTALLMFIAGAVWMYVDKQ
jgi:hypothetical protein